MDDLWKLFLEGEIHLAESKRFNWRESAIETAQKTEGCTPEHESLYAESFDLPCYKDVD